MWLPTLSYGVHAFWVTYHPKHISPRNNRASNLVEIDPIIHSDTHGVTTLTLDSSPDFPASSDESGSDHASWSRWSELKPSLVPQSWAAGLALNIITHHKAASSSSSSLKTDQYQFWSTLKMLWCCIFNHVDTMSFYIACHTAETSCELLWIIRELACLQWDEALRSQF